MARLLHYSAEPFLGPVLCRAHQLSVDSKPRGLWVSVEGQDDWKSWCESERFRVERLACVAEVVLRPGAKILWLESAADIDAAHKSYVSSTSFGFFMDWPRVAINYDGIIIAPYQWSRRFDANATWYYGWDCASGCIWRPRAILEVRPMPCDKERLPS